MTIHSSSWRARLFSMTLILALLFPSLVPMTTFALNEGGSDGGSDEPGSSGGEGGEGEGEADADGDGESDAAEAEASAAAAAEVSTAAAVAGVEVSVAAVDTSKNADAKGGTSVSINGVNMSVDDAMSAIGAIADAQVAGLSPAANPGAPGIDVNATLEATANGGINRGDVVGSASGVAGSIADVTDAEVSVAVGRSATGATVAALTDAAFDSRFGSNAVAVPSQTLSQALGKVGANIISNTAFIAQETLGVKAAAATQQAAQLNLAQGLGRVTTDDKAAYEAYQTAVAPAKAAYEAASRNFDAALDANNEAAIEAALAEIGVAQNAMEAVAQSHFGVATLSVSFAESGPGRGSTGGGSGSGGQTGVGVGGTGSVGIGTGASGSNTTFSYDSRTGTFTGNKDGRGYTANDLAGAGSTAAAVTSRSGAGTVTTVDTSKQVVSTLNTRTGAINNFEYGGGEAAPPGSYGQAGVDIAAGQFTKTELGNYQVTSAIQTTPATDLATGKTKVGSAPSDIQQDALAHGFSLSKPSTVVALGYVHEIDARTRADIVNAYRENKDFSTLSDGAITEVSGMLNALAGEAARTNRTIAEQIAVPYYLSSVTVDKNAFDTLSNQETREALEALAEELIDGSLSQERGLNVTVPVAKANHFYASYANPSWAASIANPTEVGQYIKTIVGFIPSETNPVTEGVQSAVVRSPALVSSDPMMQNSPGFAVTVKGPSPTLLANDISDLTLPDATAYAPVAPTPAGVEAIENVIGEDFEGRVHPVNGGPVRGNSAVYGPRTRINSLGVGYASVHRGTDIYGNNLTTDREVRSVSAGTVAYMAPARGYGIVVDIRDDKTGVISRYTHIEPVAGLKVGDSVKAGQMIAKIDGAGTAFGKAVAAIQERDGVDKDTAFAAAVAHFEKNGWGNVTPPHLHYEERTCAGCFGGKGIIDSTTSLGYEKGKTYAGGTPIGSPAGTPAVTPPTAVAAPVPDTIPDRVAEEVTKALERAGVPQDNPIVKDVVPAVVKTVINAGVPLTARLAVEILGRTNIFNDLFTNTGGPVTPSLPNEGGEGCTDGDPNCFTEEQGAMLWAGVQNNDWVISVLNKLWPISSTNEAFVSEVVTTSASASIKVPVTITVNLATGEIELSREDMLQALTEYESGADTVNEEDVEVFLTEQSQTEPIVFNDAGEIIYSNGLYSPETVNTETYDDGLVEYVYIVKYVDANGQLLETGNDISSLPENALTRLVKKLVTNNSSFSIDDVTSVTYRLIDPDRNVPRDEYYDYVIRLTNGDVRAVTVPQFSSILLMKERFGTIGYEGEAVDLISRAYETNEEPPSSLFGQLVDWVSGVFTDIASPAEPGSSGVGANIFPDLTSDIKASDITAVFIYPLADVNCPVMDGESRGFAYTLVANSRTETDTVNIISDARCGFGDAADLISETARHLNETYGISDVSYSNIVDKTAFRMEPVIHTPGVFSAYVGEEPDINVPETEIPTEPGSTSTSSPAQLPNLTNEIIFEVKAVGQNGQTLADWTTAERIEISGGTQLYFRWDGTAYQQCLPFLNDNGNYALTVSNRAMVSGNTEAEGYNVSERSAVYRLECGGQRNNEFGVDAREIEVVVN